MTTAPDPAGSDRSEAAVWLRDVEFAWPAGGFRLRVGAFDVARGERVLLLGHSGSGKSTLLSLICGLVSPDCGSIHVAGHDLTALSGARRDRVRADEIGVIFQMFNLLPYATGLDNILASLLFSRQRRARCEHPRASALALTAALGLSDDLVVNGPAAALSVGQQQRIAAARALIGGPGLIVADEPTSALDADAQADFLAILADQVARTGGTLIMVSHDQALAPRFDRVVALADVTQAQQGGAA